MVPGQGNTFVATGGIRDAKIAIRCKHRKDSFELSSHGCFTDKAGK